MHEMDLWMVVRTVLLNALHSAAFDTMGIDVDLRV